MAKVPAAAFERASKAQCLKKAMPGLIEISPASIESNEQRSNSRSSHKDSSWPARHSPVETLRASAKSAPRRGKTLFMSLRFLLFLRGFERIQQVGILGESLQHLHNLSRPESRTHQPSVSRCQVLVLLKQPLALRTPILLANPILDQRHLIHILVNLLHGCFRQIRRDAMLPKILQNPCPAKSIVGEARRGIALGEPSVVEISVFLQSRQNVIHVTGTLGATPEFLAQFADGIRPAAQGFQCV